MVDATEVGDDDGHGQRDDEHAAEGADAAHQLPHGRAGHHVSVPAGKERDRAVSEQSSSRCARGKRNQEVLENDCITCNTLVTCAFNYLFSDVRVLSLL